MGNAHRAIQSDGSARSGSGPERDAVQLARALRRAGPLHLGELMERPELDDWPASRIEGAVVEAWSQSLIYVDVRDQLVAI
ncbi:MAG TPA: hypothetical protein VFE07_00505 [Marmoricola sp.]|nr:hypothetical protein [Marmoricola sp.]